MSSSEPQGKVWIIKASTQILGPYTQQEVKDLINARQIVPIDEIAPAFGNWSYVRDLEIFREELLKANANRPGDDETKTVNSVTQSVTDQLTSTSLENTDELTSAGSADRTNPLPDIKPLNTNHLPKPNINSQPKKSGAGFKFLFLMCFFMVTALGAYYGYDYYLIATGQGFSFERSLSEASQNYTKGNYESAYKHFQTIVNKSEVQSMPNGFYLQMATLVLNQDRQTVYARDLLAQSPQIVKDSPEWLSAQGLSYLIDQNYQQATSLLLKSLEKNPSFLAAWINLGHVYFAQEKYQEAWDFYYGAYIRGYKEGHIPMYMALSLIEQWRVSSNRSLLVRAKSLVESFLATNADRKDYLNIISIWLSHKLSQRAEISSKIFHFIQGDPYSFQQIKSNPYEFVFEPKKLESYCKDVFESLQSSLHNLLYTSLCYQRLGFVGEMVERPINKAEEKFSGQPLVYGAQAVVLNQMGAQYQKSLLIGRALSSDKKSQYILPIILQAHFCENKGDNNCAYKYWKLVNEKDKLVIGAYAGIAKYHVSKGEVEKAREWISSGLLLAPSHKPLIELQMKFM